MTEFEVYRRNSSPSVRGPAVTIMYRGQLAMNDAAFAALGKPKAVELMYSRPDMVIGIRPVDPDAPHAYVPRTASKNRGRGPHVVAGGAFMTYFAIEIKETKRYPVNVQDGTLIIDLKQPGLPVTSGRASRAELDGDMAGHG